MADPTFRAASSIVLVPSSGSATSVDVDKPTGTVDGDYIFIVIVTTATTNAANSAPSGFGSAILTVANGLYNSGFRVFGKVASSEPSTYTLTETSANANGSAFAISYSNPGGTPINASDVTSFQNGTAAPSFPTLTTSATGKLIGFVIEHLGSTITISAAGSMTSRVAQASARSFMWAEEDIATTGSISGRTASGSTSNYVTGALLLTAGGGGGSSYTPLTGGLTRGILTKGRLIS